MRMLAWALALAPSVVACSSGSPDNGTDASTDASAEASSEKDVTSSDVQASNDATMPGDSSAITDGGSNDGASPLAPNPPQGTTLCGSGTFSETDAIQTCKASQLAFGSLIADCGGVSMSSGHWEAWCSSTSVYMWAEFDGLETSTSQCPRYFLDPDYEFANGGGNTGNNVLDGYASTGGEIAGQSSIDAAVWATLSNVAVPGAGSLYIGTTLDPQCKSDAPAQYLMLGAAISWK